MTYITYLVTEYEHWHLCINQFNGFIFSEIALQTPCVVKMTSNQTILYPPPIMSSMSSDNVKDR